MAEDGALHPATPAPLAPAYQGTYQVQPLPFSATSSGMQSIVGPEAPSRAPEGVGMAVARRGVVSTLRGAP
jgi:hypothetical protein